LASGNDCKHKMTASLCLNLAKLFEGPT
jgi:hypothetical protein